MTAGLSLDYANLPYYALRTTLRMFAALAASLVFTFTYATIAAKSRRAEMVLISLLDVLQSVPILGFLCSPSPFSSACSPARRLARTRRHLRHLHQPGLEHGVFLLSVVAHGSERLMKWRSAIIFRPGRNSGSSKRPFAMPSLTP